MHQKKGITASFIFLSIKTWVRAGQESAGGTGSPCRGITASHSLTLQPIATTHLTCPADLLRLSGFAQKRYLLIKRARSMCVGAEAKRKNFAWITTGLFSKEGDLVRKLQSCREANKGVKFIPTFQLSLEWKIKCR